MSFALALGLTSDRRPLEEDVTRRTTDRALRRLRESLTGDVLVPSDRDYEVARLCFNLLVDRRPAAIARCVDADDAATALAFAQEHDLEVAVRGGGHNPAGHCAVDDGLVIDLSPMREV